MSDGSAIEWTDATWNPLLGCTKVSPGCDHCYAITTARIRESNPNAKISTAYAGIVHRDEAGRLDWTSQVNLLEERLDQPLHWKKPRRIFVNSQADLFHDQVPDQFIAEVFAVMALASQHTFQILTKRHGRMHALLNDHDWWADVALAIIAHEVIDKVTVPQHLVLPVGPNWYPLPNVHLGVSVESQKWASIRIPALAHTPAAVRILSLEPLLGPVDLDLWKWLIDWVIVGGESGRGARPMHPDWARSLRDQCAVADVPFLFKQWGEWAPPATEPSDGEAARLKAICVQPDGQITPWDQEPYGTPAATMVHLGKKAAGRELDGRTWDQYPAAVA